MNRDQFESLPSKIYPTVTVGDLGQPDRTLAYGYTCDRYTFHVYLQDARIHRIVYRHDGATVSYSIGHVADAHGLIPDKRLYPESTDHRFALLMLGKGLELPFTRFDDARAEKVQGLVFHGRVHSVAPEEG